MDAEAQHNSSIGRGGGGFRLLAALAGLAIAGPLTAAEIAAPDPLSIRGDNFAGIPSADQARTGPIELAAREARVWEVAGDEDAGAGRVQRLLLTGDVRLRLGDFRFHCKRAAVWIQRIETDATGVSTYRVFGYLGEVGEPRADAAVAFSADRLPVEGLVRALDGVVLRVDRIVPGEPVSSFVTESERALAAVLRAQVGGTEWVKRARLLLGDEEALVAPDPVQEAERLELAEETRRALEGALGRGPLGDPEAPIFNPEGSIALAADDLTFTGAEAGSAVVATGGVTVQYWNRPTNEQLDLTAARAVVFLDPDGAAGGAAGAGRFAAADVLGVYLEGGVIASDGSYTVRSPRVYYDVRANRALLLDAVFWTYDARRGMPLYLRAQAIRQESARQFSAKDATVANTAFFRPQFSLGVDTVTVTVRDDEPERPETDEPALAGGTRTRVDARNITFEAFGVPFAYWPVFRGDPDRFPLRDLSIASGQGSGVGVRTSWNTETLLGYESGSGFDAETLIDLYERRGLGIGQRFDWNTGDSVGELLTYWLPEDNGEDVTARGVDIDADGDSRALVIGEQRFRLSQQWTVLAEVGYLSDERLAQALFRDIATERREVTNRLLFRRTDESDYATIDLQARAGDFIPNEDLLQSQGYSVDKYPEIGLGRIGFDLLGAEAPGLLSYTGEASVGVMRQRFVDTKPEDIGFTNPVASREAFGVDPGVPIAERLRGEGLSEKPVTRFDTRHEVSAQLENGPVRVTPFVTGRFTAYDTGFEEYNNGEDASERIFGALGVRATTAIQRVYNGVESRLLGLHRLRHVVEPSFVAWFGGSNVEANNLPVYDEEVESLAEGTLLSAAVDQSFQTKRGGPGRWRTEEFLNLRTELSWSSDDANIESPIPRFYEARPELSNPGNALTNRLTYKPTGVLSIVGESVFDYDDEQQITSALGVRLDHSPVLSSTAELRRIEPLDSTRVVLGSSYTLGPKYRARLGMTFNTEPGELQTLASVLERSYPNVIVVSSLRFNNVTGETSFGFTFEPRVGNDRVRGGGGLLDRLRPENRQ